MYLRGKEEKCCTRLWTNIRTRAKTSVLRRTRLSGVIHTGEKGGEEVRHCCSNGTRVIYYVFIHNTTHTYFARAVKAFVRTVAAPTRSATVLRQLRGNCARPRGLGTPARFNYNLFVSVRIQQPFAWQKVPTFAFRHPFTVRTLRASPSVARRS